MPTHAEHKLVPYTAEQMFDLVADVGHYHDFLPWCVGSVVNSRTATDLEADLKIGFGPFREGFTSRVALDRPKTVNVKYEDGPFRYLNNQWTFTPVNNGCRVDFYVDFEFRSRMLQSAIGVVFNQAVQAMVKAFLKRAREIYGRPTATVSVTPVPAKA